MATEPEEKAAKQKNIFNLVNSVFFLVLGIAVLSGWFVPYTPVPNADLLSNERGILSLGEQNDSFDFTSSTRTTVPLCRNTWIDAEDISSYFGLTKEIEAEVTVYSEDQKNNHGRCLIVFGLTIGEKTVVDIDDVKKAKEFTKIVFNSIGIIFIMVGLFKGFALRKSINS